MEKGKISDPFQGIAGFLKVAVTSAGHLVTELMFLKHYCLGDCYQMFCPLDIKALHNFLCSPT